MKQNRDPWRQQASSFDAGQSHQAWERAGPAKQVSDASAVRATIHVRSIFLSDVHLGTVACQADLLRDFLRSYDADVIYLVGDIIDGWQLQSRWYWPQAHGEVLHELSLKARHGAKVVYLPGNHDEFLRAYVGSTFEGIEIRDWALHSGVDGRRYLVIHGDQFDALIQHARWLALLGDWAYQTLLLVNACLNIARRRLGLAYWSLSAWAKLSVKNVVSYISRFEELLSTEAQRHGAQGVICGHIHHATLRDDLPVRYVNTGDWVESCTGVVEHHDGRFEILRWAEAVGGPIIAAQHRRRGHLRRSARRADAIGETAAAFLGKRMLPARVPSARWPAGRALSVRDGRR